MLMQNLKKSLFKNISCWYCRTRGNLMVFSFSTMLTKHTRSYVMSHFFGFLGQVELFFLQSMLDYTPNYLLFNYKT